MQRAATIVVFGTGSSTFTLRTTLRPSGARAQRKPWFKPKMNEVISRPLVQRPKFTARTNALDVAALFIPLTQAFEVSLGGRLTGPDVLLFLSFFALLPKRSFWLTRPVPKVFFALLACWLVGSVLTDLVRETPAVDLARGWSGIVAFGVDFAAIVMLVGDNRKRLMLLFLGVAIGGIVRAFVAPEERLIGAPLYIAWKFGFAQSFTLLTLALLAWSGRPSFRAWAGILACCCLAVLHLALNARSMFGILACSAALTAFALALRGRKITRTSIIVLAIGMVVVGWATFASYGYLASTGRLGELAMYKYHLQSKGDFGLLSGRSESFASIQAISDSPVIGHGSWARDWHYAELRANSLKAAGYDVNQSDLNDDLIPTHSHLLGAWVQAGVLGAIIWIWIASVGLRSLKAMLRNPVSVPLMSYIFLSLLWDTFFSQFGLLQRLLIAVYIACAVQILSDRPHLGIRRTIGRRRRANNKHDQTGLVVPRLGYMDTRRSR